MIEHIKAIWTILIMLILFAFFHSHAEAHIKYVDHTGGFKCDFVETFDQEMLPDFNNPEWFPTTVDFAGFVYIFFTELSSNEIVAMTVTSLVPILSIRVTWYSGNTIVTTRPLVKEDFCINVKNEKYTLTKLKKMIEQESLKEKNGN